MRGVVRLGEVLELQMRIDLCRGNPRIPEHFLHAFFQGMGTPYHAYEAESPDALGRAIADVDRLENLPIHYTETVPKLDLSQTCFAVAMACIGLLAMATLLEIKEWR